MTAGPEKASGSPYVEDEIKPGIVPFLSEDVLRASKRCQTDAPVDNKGHDMSSEKSRPFLVFDVDLKNRVCKATPTLHTENPGPSSVHLDVRLRKNFTGKANKEYIYIHSDQYVTIPFDVLIAATANELSKKGKRRQYGVENPLALKLITNLYEQDGKPLRGMRTLMPRSSSDPGRPVCQTEDESDDSED